jgi:hypothetical protein
VRCQGSEKPAKSTIHGSARALQNGTTNRACIDAAQKETEMTHLHALVVGINIYKSEKLRNYPLRGCVNDVDRMSRVLTQMFANELHLLTLTEAQASRAAIFESFRSHLIEPAKIWVQSGRPSPEPAFLFHFSGHGSLARDVTQTKPSGFDETVVPYDSRQADIFDIRDWELGALIDELGQYSSCITIVLDCCHSGSGTRSTGRMCEPDLRTPPLRNPAKPGPAQSLGFRSSQETKMADYVLLAACHAKQIAQEYSDDSSGQTVVYGAMTYALADTLAGLASKEITCRELYELTRNKVRTWFPQQIPQCEGDRDRLLFSSERPGRDFPFIVTHCGERSLCDRRRTYSRAQQRSGVRRLSAELSLIEACRDTCRETES